MRFPLNEIDKSTKIDSLVVDESIALSYLQSYSEGKRKLMDVTDTVERRKEIHLA